MNPLISIMIATYNQPGYIVQCVESCLNQDYDNIEVVVGDDSTNNDVYNALKPLLENKKLRYFKNQKNLGRVKNYKHLLFDLAQGDWAAMMDGDDYYTDLSFFSKAVSFINSDQSVVLVSAGHLVFDEVNNKGEQQHLIDADAMFDGKDIFEKQLKLAQHSANIYKKDLALDLDFYRIDSMGTDSEGLFRLSLYGKVVYLADIVVYWRIHNDNNTFKAADAVKQMHEMIFIDNVYNYAVGHIGKATAGSWRKYMYTAMSHHIMALAEKSGSYVAVLRVARWASEFWGLPATLRFLKTYTYKRLTKK